MPMSAVLVGLVPVSKLKGFGLRECGEAVVELANHSFESPAGLGADEALVVDVLLAPPLLPGMPSEPPPEPPVSVVFEPAVAVT